MNEQEVIGGKPERRRKSFPGQLIIGHSVWEIHGAMYVTATGKLALWSCIFFFKKKKPHSCSHLPPYV